MKRFKKRFKILGSLLVLSLLMGCSLLHKTSILGNASRREDKALAKIQHIFTEIDTTKDYRLDLIGKFALGTDYTLSKVVDPTQTVLAAKSLNTRVLALANQPSLKESEAVKVLADLLITNIASGEKEMAKADKIIETLQSRVASLQVDKEEAIGNYIKVADKAAAQLDTDTARLKSYTSYFGLGGVALGLWQFGKTSFWILSGLGIVFCILRFAAMSSPLAATIFAVGEHMVSYLVNGIIALFPRCMSYLGYEKKQ